MNIELMIGVLILCLSKASLVISGQMIWKKKCLKLIVQLIL